MDLELSRELPDGRILDLFPLTYGRARVMVRWGSANETY